MSATTAASLIASRRTARTAGSSSPSRSPSSVSRAETPTRSPSGPSSGRSKSARERQASPLRETRRLGEAALLGFGVRCRVVRDQTREALVPCVAHEAGAGFFTCQAWGDLAENLASSLTKGQRVIVIGQLRQRRFEANGQQRSATEIFVQEAGPSLLWATAEVRRRALERAPEPAAR
jgi:hypothetical protein